MSKTINLTLKVWRQAGADTPGKLETYNATNIDVEMSFLEMLDVINEEIALDDGDPIAFDNDCREGICGTCGVVVNGSPHGPQKSTTLCQLHMRKFNDGDTLIIEPWRAKAFPVIKDLVVDRSALDRISQAGGYTGVKTGQAPEAHTIAVPKADSDKAMDAAACIGCGACVAACPNASAMLYVGAKVSHLGLLPQGKLDCDRVINMVNQMDAEGFGNCTNTYECEATCPKDINVSNIARMNRTHLVEKIIQRKNS